MAKLFANSEDPESAASDLGLHCLPLPVYGSLDYNGLNPVSCDIECCLRTWREGDCEKRRDGR